MSPSGLRGLLLGGFLCLLLSCGGEESPSSSSAVPGGSGAGSAPDPDDYSAVVYVAVDGNDANPGTIDLPWATAQHAADSVGPGTLVYFRGGTYRQGFETTMDGSAGARIAFAAYRGEDVVFDGTGADRSNGILLSHDYVVLHGLTTTGWESDGIWVEDAAHFVISSCTAHDVPYGIGVGPGSHDFEITGCEAYDVDGYGFDVTCDAGRECSNGVFRDCVAHSARDLDANVDGFALGHYYTRGFLFEGCRTWDMFDGFDISGRDTVLRRCTAHHCTNGGFKLWQTGILLENCLSFRNGQTNVELDWDDAVGPTSTTLSYCTLVDAETFNVVVENGASALTMRNSIMAGGDNIGLAFLEGLATHYVGDNNVFHNDNPDRLVVVFETDSEYPVGAFAAWRGASGQDAGTRLASSLPELFVDPAGDDYHLTPASPAVDAADCGQAPATDLDGVARPQGAGCDAGAYERLP